MRFLPKSTLSVLAVVAAVTACTETQDVVGPPQRQISTLQLEAVADSLARGISYAIADPSVRQTLRDDLRDSPFPAHAIHFWSYLRGARGSVVTDRAARILGISTSKFLSLEAALPNLELLIPRSMDRMSWHGGGEITVVATPMPLSARIKQHRGSERGYDLTGNPVVIPTLSYSVRPYMIIRPYEIGYPRDPEAERRQSHRPSTESITTAAEERRIMRKRGEDNARRFRLSNPSTSGTMGGTFGPRFATPPGCDPELDPNCCPTWADYCEPDPGQGPAPVGGGGATLSPDKTYYYCMGVTSTLTPASDRDNDRVQDDCEFDIASSLAPLLWQSLNDEAPGKQSYWSLGRNPDSSWIIQIFYALAWFDDAGDPTFGITSHHGDSEFIILYVRNSTTSVWGVVGATLSAHYGTEADATATYTYDDLEWPSGGHPGVWASWNKHANYRSQAVCDYGPGGIWWNDGCEGYYGGFFVGMYSDRNLGNYFNVPEASRNSATQLVNCTSSDHGPAMECFWSDSVTFGGWYADRTPEATPYRTLLETFHF